MSVEHSEHNPGFDEPSYFFGSNLSPVDAQSILRGARALVRLGAAITEPGEGEEEMRAVRFYLAADLGVDACFVAAIDEDIMKYHDGLSYEQLGEELEYLRFPLNWNDSDFSDSRSLLERCQAFLPPSVTLSQLEQ